MRIIGREHDLERINRTALRIAREVSDEKNLIFAGGTCNTNIYVEGETEEKIKAIFDEQVKWSKEEGIDYMIGETFGHLGEARLALDSIKAHGLPAVITMSVQEKIDGVLKTLDDVPIGEACKNLLANGATLVGANCTRGPDMMLEVIEEIVKFCPPERVCALPIAYRTTPKQPSFFALTDETCPGNNPVYPRGLEPFCISPVEIETFTKRCLELGLKYLGICCGNSGELTRTMATAMGRTPPASKYLDQSNFGTRQTKGGTLTRW